MNTFNSLLTRSAQQPADAESQDNSRIDNGPFMSVYAELLRAPLMRIAGNVSHRPDIASVAILGYN